MTKQEFLKLGNYITCLSSRLTIYDGTRPKIVNSMFEYIYLIGNKCCIKNKRDSSPKVCIFDSLEDTIKYVRAYPVEGMKNI